MAGTYTLEYGEKKGKGLGPAHVAQVPKKSILDSVLSLKTKKKGLIEKSELKRLVSLVENNSKSSSSSSSSSSY